jgi:hypothetical protein
MIDIKNNILELGQGLKEQFAKLDKVLDESKLSPEQKAGIKEITQGLHDAIGQMDENKIIETMKKLNKHE